MTSHRSPSLVLPPVRLIVAAGSGVARRLVAEAILEADRGTSVWVLFSEGGLDFLTTDTMLRLADAGVHTSLCSRSARLRRVEPSTVPATVTWSSLTNFLSDAGPDARLWTVFA